jgi:hypothetical protein
MNTARRRKFRPCPPRIVEKIVREIIESVHGLRALKQGCLVQLEQFAERRLKPPEAGDWPAMIRAGQQFEENLAHWKAREPQDRWDLSQKEFYAGAAARRDRIAARVIAWRDAGQQPTGGLG